MYSVETFVSKVLIRLTDFLSHLDNSIVTVLSPQYCFTKTISLLKQDS